MPNHTTCRLSVDSDETLKLVLALAWVTPPKEKEDDNLEPFFDFNKIIPMPESLKISEGSDSHHGYEALTGKPYPSILKTTQCVWERSDHWAKEGVTDQATFKAWLEKNRPEALEIGKKAIENIEKYGHTSWYDWSIEHWGTKWNAYSCGLIGNQENPTAIGFQTAWSPPLPVIKALSAKFPDATFKIEYADEGGGFIGFTTYKAGDLVEEFEPAWDSEAGVALQKDLGVWYEDEDGDSDDEEAVEPAAEDASGVEEDKD